MNSNIFKKLTKSQMLKEELSKIFLDIDHPLFLEKDINLAKKFNVVRLTIYNIRKKLKIPPRNDRIAIKVKSLHPEKYTIKEMSDTLNIKYQNLYKVLSENGIKYKPYGQD